MLRDRMNRYQDEERVLYELAVNIMNCETPKTLATLLKEYAFGDMAVVVNGDFFDERIFLFNLSIKFNIFLWAHFP